MPTELIQELNAQDKLAIFRDILPIQSAQEAHGRTTLEKLPEISPSTASKFELKKEAVAEDLFM